MAAEGLALGACVQGAFGKGVGTRSIHPGNAFPVKEEVMPIPSTVPGVRV